MKKIKPLIIILILIAIGGGAYFVNKYFLKSSSTTPTQTVSELISKNPELTPTTEKIIYAVQKEDQKEIIATDMLGKDSKIIFTDKDEDLKIKSFGGLAYLSKELLVVTSGELGSLEVIKTDGSAGKEIVVKDFGSPKALAISPNGEKISFITFSNTEADYGFGLYEISRDGKNRRQLANSGQEIKNLSWNADSNKIAFSEASGENILIKVVDTEEGKAQTIFQSNRPVLGISWNQKNKIFFSIATDDKVSSSKIETINPDGTKEETLVKLNDKLAIFPYCASDFSWLAYLQTEAKDNQVNLDNPSGLFVAPVNQDQKITDLNISANQILGFLP